MPKPRYVSLTWLLGILSSVLVAILMADRAQLFGQVPDLRGEVTTKLTRVESLLEEHRNLTGHPATIATLEALGEDIREIKSDVKQLLQRSIKP